MVKSLRSPIRVTTSQSFLSEEGNELASVLWVDVHFFLIKKKTYSGSKIFHGIIAINVINVMKFVPLVILSHVTELQNYGKWPWRASNVRSIVFNN